METDTDVVVVGAGPCGLMLACELALAGMRVVLLDRLAEPSPIAKAGGLSGQIVHMLRYRGQWERFAKAPGAVQPPYRFPWGGISVDLTRMADPPLPALMLPQPQIEAGLAAWATQLGVEIRRPQELVGLRQDDDGITAQLPEGTVTARYLVGCDGAHSRVRKLMGIGFVGMTYPEVNWRASVGLHGSITVLAGGDIEVPGLGRLKAGFTTTERGTFAFAMTTPGQLGVFTSEDDVRVDDESAVTVEELRASLRRVLGGELPFGDVTRLTRFSYHARQAERYRQGRILLAGDAAHLFPAPGVGLNAVMLDAVNLGWKLAAAAQGWAPAALLDSYETERRHAADRTTWHAQAQVALRRGHDAASQALREVVQALLADEAPARRVGAMIAGSDIRYPVANGHALAGGLVPDLMLHSGSGPKSIATYLKPGRGILVDLAGREALRAAALPWRARVDVHAATCDNPPAEALLIRPDAVVAWAAGAGEPDAVALPALQTALTTWFGEPGA